MKHLFLIFTLLALTGCASIVGDTTQLVPINTEPDGAAITITNKAGSVVYKGTSPTAVTLKKSDGTYFGGETYTIAINKPGYTGRTVVIDSYPNGWYIAGNFLFGGLIGWLVVDPLTGAMYTLSPDSVNESLDKGSLKVTLLSELPADLRPRLVVIE